MSFDSDRAGLPEVVRITLCRGRETPFTCLEARGSTKKNPQRYRERMEEARAACASKAEAGWSSARTLERSAGVDGRFEVRQVESHLAGVRSAGDDSDADAARAARTVLSSQWISSAAMATR